MDEETFNVVWTNRVKLRIRIILSDSSVQTMIFSCRTSDKVLNLAEQIGDVFGETKYSTSFFN